MPLRIGETFAGYRILQLLGSGGMGEVFLVQHPRLPRHDALKVLRPDVSSDTSFRERFIREADLAAGLRHPHIVGIHDRGESNGQLWIAMDYIDGTDAAQMMQQRYPAGMPADLAIPIITAVGSALDHAHKKGLLHRDVKPANIIVADLESDDRSVFLADFGIARPLDDTSGITTTNMTVGTVAYAAPEQLMGEDIDGRADQYALAATTYHLLTGSQLFPHSNPAVVISRHLNTPPPSLALMRPELPLLDPILAAALAKDPCGRFPSCTDFARAVAEQVTAHSAHSSAAPTAQAPAPRRPGRPAERTSAAAVGSASRRLSWRQPGFLIAAVATVLMVLAGATLAISQTRGRDTVVPTAESPMSTGQPVPTPPTSSAPTSAASASAPENPDSTGGWGAKTPVPFPTRSVPNPPAPTFSAPTRPRVSDLSNSFSFVVPQGWQMADASRLAYGSALLNHGTDEDTSIVLGNLDSKLFAAAEPDNMQASVRLASDMGEYFFPFPGTRINPATIPLGGGLPGGASYYEVKFNDTAKPNAQIWSAAIGSGSRRYFVVWLGTVDNPINKVAARALAESVQP
jgi:serine/threonine-protein kinase